MKKGVIMAHVIMYKKKAYPEGAISGGGSGGGGIEITTLYEGTTYTSPITLDDDYTNYDYLLFTGYATAGTGYLQSNLYKVSDLEINNNIGVADDGNFSWWKITSATTLTNNGSLGTYYVKKVYGIKASGSGGTSINYSLQEQEIGTWIDGSALYQITVPTGGNAPSGSLILQRIEQTGYDTLLYKKVTRTLVYTVTVGGQWETFSNPQSANDLIIEATNNGVTNTWLVDVSDLAEYGNYTTLGVIPNTDINVNMARTSDSQTLYISGSRTYDTSTASIKVYTYS